MHWLGAYDAIAQMMVLWHDVPVRTLDDLRSKEFVVGSFNKTHLSYQWAMLTKNILGTNYKVTTGYPSGNHLNLAMERGEIAGWTDLLGKSLRSEAGMAARKEGLRLRAVHGRAPARTAGRADARRDFAARPSGDGGVHRLGHAVRARAWRSAPACRRTALLRCARRSTT